MIREYKRGEIAHLASIFDECFPGKINQLLDVLEKFKYIVLIEGQASHSNGMLVSILDEGEPWIWTIAVRPDFQGLGRGTELLKEIEKKYPGYKRMSLYVGVNNPAQKLYFDLGYRVVEVLKDIYEDQDALKMVKNLQ